MIWDFMGRRPLPVRDYVVSIKTSFFGLVPPHMDSPNFWYFILLLGMVLYRNHMVSDQQGSAAHEIKKNNWISPTLYPWILKSLDFGISTKASTKSDDSDEIPKMQSF